MTKDPIDLRKGHPNPSLLPVTQIKAAATEALIDPEIYTSKSGLLYAPDPGYEPLRERTAAWLTAFYQSRDPISPQRICITGGASQNLACILQVFSDPLYTRNVWLVSPTYFHACKIFEDGGFHGRLRSVPEDEEGIDIGLLEEKIAESEEIARKAGNHTPVRGPPNDKHIARKWAEK